MGFKFFRRKKLAPGITLNLSKSGPSVSVGPKGAKHTVGPKGSRTMLSVPGTGVRYTSEHKRSKQKRGKNVSTTAGFGDLMDRVATDTDAAFKQMQESMRYWQAQDWEHSLRAVTTALGSIQQAQSTLDTVPLNAHPRIRDFRQGLALRVEALTIMKAAAETKRSAPEQDDEGSALLRAGWKKHEESDRYFQ